MMPFRVTSISRRVWWSAFIIAGAAALLVTLIFSDPNGTQPANIALMSVLLAWLIAIGVRGVRSATLIATPYRVTARELVKTMQWSWPVIEGLVAGTRLTLVLWLPGIRLRRRVLGVVYSGGRTRWLPGLSCRVRNGASAWVDASAARLNELLAAAAGDAGQRA
jgi:hypothetical protein